MAQLPIPDKESGPVCRAEPSRAVAGRGQFLVWDVDQRSVGGVCFRSVPYFCLRRAFGRFCGKVLLPQTEWIIIGCEELLPSHRNLPKRDWLDVILEQRGDTPVYIKRNSAIRTNWKGRLIQQYPVLLKRPKDKPIPRCNSCPDCEIIQEGKRGNRHICHHRKVLNRYKGTSGQHIPGRYTRTSPPWCPKR